MDEEEPRSNRAEALGGLLNTHLQRLSEMRAKNPPEEITPPPSNVRHLPTIKPAERIAPATPEQIIAELVMLDVIYPFPTLSVEERSLRYRIFCEDLAPFPIERIRKACEDYRRDSHNKFFPTPGQLLGGIKWDRLATVLQGMPDPYPEACSK